MIQQYITAIIVDDEEKARNMLHMLLAEHCPHVTVLAQCKNVPEVFHGEMEIIVLFLFIIYIICVYSGATGVNMTDR